MKLLNSCSLASLILGLAVLAPAATVRAEDAPAAEPKAEKKAVKPAEEKAKPAVRGPKLWGLWAKLTTLTPEQKIKMSEIHKKALEDKRAIDDKEEADITALLTDEQKLEVQKLKEDDAARRKEMSEKHKKPEPKAAGEKKSDAPAAEEKNDGM